MTTITRNTPWRHIGAVPYAIWKKRINDAGGLSRVADYAVWQAAGDDSALMLEFLRAESSYASDFAAIPAAWNNPWNLQIAGVGLKFDSIVDCVSAWRERLYSTTYKQGIYARTVTIADLISVYAPKSDGNDTEGYIAKVVAGMNRNGFDPPVTTPATPEEPVEQEKPMATPQRLDYSSLPFPVEVKFIPVGQTNQRTGIPMTPQWTTWHDTGNPGVGARSDMHHAWMLNGCRGANGQPTKTSWHFTVDDKKAIQHIPLNEVAWHAGDGSGPGNYTSIAIEECVNSDRNAAKTRENAARLHALLIRELGLKGGKIDALTQHNKWSGKNCPATIRGAGLWSSVVAMTNGFIGTVATIPPDATYVDAHPVAKGSRIINEHIFFAPGGKTVQIDVYPYEWGDADAAPTGPKIKKGTKIDQAQISHYVQGTDNNLWIVVSGLAGVKDGSRIPATALVADAA